MRILQINTISGTTSVGILTDSIAKALIECGHEAYMASGRGRSKIDGVEQINIGTKFDTYIHGIATRLTDSHAMHSIRATKNLIDKILEIKPELIHLHNLHGYYIHLPLLISFLKKVKIPVVFTLHDCWLMTGHCAHPMITDCHKYKEASCHKCPQRNSYPKSFYDGSERNIKLKHKLFSRETENFYFVANSRWMAEIIHDSWLSHHPIYIINNGIDTDIFTLSTQKRKPKVIGVANVWTKAKGLNDFITLRSILPSHIEIELIGLSNNQKSNLPEGIIGTGYLSQQDLATKYQESMALINLSYAETFGNTIIESMSCGTPIISYDNTAPHYNISPHTGVLIENGNIKSVAKEIIKLSSNQFNNQKCSQHAQQNYSAPIMAKAYIKLYEYLT